ncbi:ADP-ribosylglycohydrolase [Anaerotaenia torta]
MVDNFLDKLYAGFLGMNAGIRLGAPVEPVPWDFDRIAAVYGEITGYLKQYKNFAADDDVNGPVYFLRGLTDHGVKKELTAEQLGNAWLNYTRNGIGMFWWGGYGVSTEHTAYQNLKNGIRAPESGSIRQNGLITAEQIGGQIFIDTWGFIWPGNPKKAAEYAVKAASVSHDGNGLYGAAFIAACIAEAFVSDRIEDILEAGLKQIPPDSTYAGVVKATRAFHREHPEHWQDCMRYLMENWGYDKYGGVCHIIPNAGVCVLALLYGQGDFNRTIEIASMCGWDTDCNAGNVGSIAGVLCGLKGIKKAYREPINDVIITSGISGYLNIMDVPTYVKDLADIAYRLRDEELPKEIERPEDGDILFDFELPGATHGIRLSNEIRFMKRHSTERAFRGQGSLELLIDRILPEDQCRVYYKPFYRREDFDDERYKPVFSPTVYSGQKVSMELYPELWLEGPIEVIPYIRTAMKDEILELKETLLIKDTWNRIEFEIPDTKGDQTAEVGFRIQTPKETKSRVFGRIFLDDLTIRGDADYSIDMALQAREFAQVTPFSLNQCEAGLKEGRLLITSDQECQAFTGNYYAKDITVEADILPLEGAKKGLLLRGMGAECGYLLGFGQQGEAVISRLHHERTILAKTDYDWQPGTSYQLKACAEGNKLTLSINGEAILSAQDESFPYGMTGFYQEEAGSFLTGGMRIRTVTGKGSQRIRD